MSATALLLTLVAVPATAAAPREAGHRVGRPPEFHETTRLADRRAVVIGDRLYATSTADGLYPAMGFHTRGEMGGVWSPPIKLLDGIWFNVAGRWLGAGTPAERFTSGWGYHRIRYRQRGGLAVQRTDVVPDGVRAGLIGLTLRSSAPRTVRLAVDARSELLSTYPWGETTSSQLTYNLDDEGAYDVTGRLVFTERGTPPVDTASTHDWTAVVGSTVQPTTAPPPGARSSWAAGPGGHLPGVGSRRAGAAGAVRRHGVWARYRRTPGVPGEAARRPSHHRVVRRRRLGPQRRRGPRRRRRGAGRSGRVAAATVARRVREGSYSVVDLPGDRLLQRSIEWSK